MRTSLADANSVVKGSREILNPGRSSFARMSAEEHGGSNTRRKVSIPKRQRTLLSAPTARDIFQRMGISSGNTAVMIAMSWTVFGRMAI
nr:hypothetical protein [uncultured Butyrivibrio sp.]